MITHIAYEAVLKLTSDTTSVFRGEGDDEYAGDGRGNHHRANMDDVMVCLTCTKAQCQGGEECFRNRKRKMKGGG